MPDSRPADPDFARQLLAWQKRHGRHDLPWQGTRDPYRIWVSEIMLQQTQVTAVIPYYQRFMARFPDVRALAAAGEDEVLRHWSGLGYYARARNLHRAARIVAEAGGGRFPRSAQGLAELPGIGRSTAAAIAAFAWGERVAILDGNVKRVLARRFGVEGFPGAGPVEAGLWALAESLLPERGVEAYTQGLMDLGATLCTRGKPDCGRCPLREDCVALNTGRVAELPAARPKKAYPTREATWLVLLHAGEVLLERRPPTGLWGGLWVFPEPAGADIAACAERLGCELVAQRELARFAHGFTHFRLDVRPVLCEVRSRAAHAEAGGGRIWMPLAQAAEAALPTPVKALLLALKV